uniref:Uncharacterized protein n=1 Tax=Arundo donax TaxID=35708 RepID=A0A0A9BRU7_ARUDO
MGRKEGSSEEGLLPQRRRRGYVHASGVGRRRRRRRA